MTRIDFDPYSRCAHAVRQLHKCLIEEGQRLVASGHKQQALDVLYRAYSLRPGVAQVLRSIGKIHADSGDDDLADSCRRAVVPESDEKRYFNARYIKKSIITAKSASNGRHLRAYHPESIFLNTPKSNTSPKKRPEFRATQTESRGSFVSSLNDAAFWFDGFNTVVKDKKRNLLKEHIKGSACVVTDSAKHRPEQILDGTVCFLDARSSAIYYHWMIDVLPKFAVLAAAGIELASIDYFVVRCRSEFQEQTLKQLGVPLDRVIDPWNDGFTRCSKLFVPFLKHDRGDRFYNGLGLGMARWVPKWLKEVFLEENPVCQQKIYISRASRGTRSPAGEQALIVQLQDRGFTSVTLENLSVSEQAITLASAKIVVAPHGAGLTNITFCQPGTTVIEIFGDYVVPCYWSLCELSGLDYHAFFASSPDAASLVKSDANAWPKSLSKRRDQGIDLDSDSFLNYVDQLLAGAAKVEQLFG